MAAVILTLAGQTLASDLRFGILLDCTLGDDCYIQKHADHDLTDGYRDFACGTLSSDTHNGTDFALLDLAALDKGVAVKAAALGIVDRLRDGVPDTGVAAGVETRNCGNGIVNRYNDGFETQYCHLKNVSIPVKKGDVVREGDILGEVGFSGLTKFPHVHFTVRGDGEVIDPFSPDQIGTCGQTADAGLWADDLPYRPGGLIRIGVAFGVPDYQAIKEGYLGETSLPQDAPALVVWGYGFGDCAGDEVHMVVQGPKGVFYECTNVLDRAQTLFLGPVGGASNRMAGRLGPIGAPLPSVGMATSSPTNPSKSNRN